MANTFLQWPIISEYLLPFLLIFFIVFAILDKTKLFGEGKKQVNALTAGVIALIFVGAISYTHIISNLTLFLTVAIVILFVVLLLWGFIWGEKESGKGFQAEKWMKWILGIVAGIAVIWAVIWATGSLDKIGGFFSGTTGQTIITNGVFLIVIAVALALVLMKPKS
jgi:hypothetical protein